MVIHEGPDADHCCVGGSALYARPMTIRPWAAVQGTWHASTGVARWSMLIVLLHWVYGAQRAGSDRQGQLDDNDDDVKVTAPAAAAAEHVHSGGCWSAGVYDAYNTQEGLDTYLFPVVGRYMVDCHGSALCCISPFNVLFNPLQNYFPPLIYEWKLLPRDAAWGEPWQENLTGFLSFPQLESSIQFTPFITPGPGDKWWGGLFNAGSLPVPFRVNEQQWRWETHSQGSSIIILHKM